MAPITCGIVIGSRARDGDCATIAVKSTCDGYIKDLGLVNYFSTLLYFYYVDILIGFRPPCTFHS